MPFNLHLSNKKLSFRSADYFSFYNFLARMRSFSFFSDTIFSKLCNRSYKSSFGACYKPYVQMIMASSYFSKYYKA